MIKLAFKVALFLIACWVVLFFAMGYKPLKALPDVLVLHVSDPLNVDFVNQEHSIDTNELVHVRLKRLIVDDESFWVPKFASYIGAPIIFTGEGLSISCYPDLIVLDYFRFGYWWSYEKRIPGLLVFLGLSKSKSIASRNNQ